MPKYLSSRNLALWPAPESTFGYARYDVSRPPTPALPCESQVWCAQIFPEHLVLGTVVGANSATEPDVYYVDLGAPLSDEHPYRVISVLYTLILLPEEAQRVNIARGMALLEALPDSQLVYRT